MTTTTKMTRAEFWAEVARIGWGTETTDHRQVKIGLLRKGEAHCDGMREHFHAVDTALLKAGCDLHGGDSVGDCRVHIIGLGKTEYDRVMADLSLGEKRYKSGDYKESFAYCIPYETDFEDLKPKRFQEWAGRNVEELDANVEAIREIDRRLAQDIDRIIGIHNLIVEGDLDAAAEAADEATALIESVAKRHTALIDRIGGRGGGMSKWGFLNLFSDLRKRAEVLA